MLKYSLGSQGERYIGKCPRAAALSIMQRCIRGSLTVKGCAQAELSGLDLGGLPPIAKEVELRRAQEHAEIRARQRLWTERGARALAAAEDMPDEPGHGLRCCAVLFLCHLHRDHKIGCVKKGSPTEVLHKELWRLNGLRAVKAMCIA